MSALNNFEKCLVFLKEKKSWFREVGRWWMAYVLGTNRISHRVFVGDCGEQGSVVGDVGREGVC
jgi:hypothetical protein